MTIQELQITPDVTKKRYMSRLGTYIELTLILNVLTLTKTNLRRLYNYYLVRLGVTAKKSIDIKYFILVDIDNCR